MLPVSILKFNSSILENQRTIKQKMKLTNQLN